MTNPHAIVTNNEGVVIGYYPSLKDAQNDLAKIAEYCDRACEFIKLDDASADFEVYWDGFPSNIFITLVDKYGLT